MKSIKTMLFLCSAVLLLSANCNKKNKVYQVLKGRIMQDCTTPYANKIVKLKGSNGYSPSFCEDENGNKEFYTDANGYFEIRFKRNGSKVNLYAKYEVMMDITINESPMLDIGEVNIGGKVNFVIKLDVNNPRTQYDTLILQDFNGTSIYSKLRIPGPFVTGIVDTVINEGFPSYPFTYNKPLVFNRFGYHFSSDPSEITYSNFNVNFCSSTLSEAIITIN